MKLVIREYLSMLKESGELDQLLPDLMMNMGIVPLSKAQVGTRQFGVDLAARGKDPEDGDEKLFLISIKAGNITRSVWDSQDNPQSVRPSLNEILDVYIPKKIREVHQDLVKKIILCCNGDLKQEVDDNWKSYVDKNSKEGKIEFEFWGADKLSILIEENFLDEYLFPESARKNIRKTLTLIDDPDYDLSHYYQFVKDTFKLVKPKDGKLTQKKAIRGLRLLNLSLRIIYYWSREENNLKPAFLAAERTLLLVYDFLLKSEMVDNKKISETFGKIYSTYITVSRLLYNKLEPHFYVRDGLYGYGADKYDYPLRTFETIGIISSIGLDQLYLGLIKEDKDIINHAKVIAHGLKNLIDNNPASKTPLYDGHAIDIGLGILLLYHSNLHQFGITWINDLLARIVFAYQSGRYYPIFTDSYDDLMDFEAGDPKSKEKLLSISSLIPLLMQWLVIFECKDKYEKHQDSILRELQHTNFQIWYPDEETDDYLYKEFAARKSGSALYSIQFQEEFEKFKESIIKAFEKDSSLENIACMKELPSLSFIACRHYRTPLIPFHWQSLVKFETEV